MLSASEFVTSHLKKLEDYITGVTSGRIVSGKLQVQAVQRFIEYKERFEYRQKELERILKFCSLLNIPLKNEVQQVSLLGWQVFVIANLYCLYRTETKRVFGISYIEISKKQGKTTLAAIISLVDALIDNELNASVLFVACSKDQARIALDITKAIISNSPYIQPFFDVNKNIIVNEQKGSINKIEVKAADAKLVQGSGVSLSIVDEFAFSSDSELQNKIRSGQIARHNALQLIITTACNDKQSPAFSLRETCINILSKVIDNDSMFALIFSLDSKEEIEDSSKWIKSNPSLGHTVQLENLEEEYETAKLLPDKLNTFITDNLNMWIDNLVEVWIEDDVIKEAMQDDLQIPDKAEVFIGLDLSANSDLCSIGILHFDKANDRFIGKVINIFPNNEKKRIRAGSIDLTRWIDSGHIIRCQTQVLDENLVYDLLIELSNKYSIQSIGVDPWNSRALADRLKNKLWTEVNDVPQTLRSLSYPLKVMETHILMRKFFFAKSPVTRWNFQNVKLYTDINHNRKVDKRKGEAVDGVISLLICMHEYLALNAMNYDALAAGYRKALNGKQKED